ncbi:hypothetical protein, partial [Micrococcus sp. GbtcB5]|uniref:hypothetical protein n=1 Tax=Micrococcus sp. GbtcB5 TaxID=2824750 RepID=UPI001C2F4F6D
MGARAAHAGQRGPQGRTAPARPTITTRCGTCRREEDRAVHVAVVGAGIIGLTAAARLRAAG